MSAPVTSLSIVPVSALLRDTEAGRTLAKDVVDLATYINGTIVPQINSLIGKANNP